MKKSTYFGISLFSALFFCSENLYSQTTQSGIGGLGHLAGGTANNYYLGWNAGSSIPLQIRHDGNNQPITFHTAGSQRMTIKPTGLVGIGSNFINPVGLLHVNGNATGAGATPTGNVFYTSGPANLANSWRLFTGAGIGTEKFRILIPATSSDVRINATTSIGAMELQTGGLTRMYIRANDGVFNYGVNTSGFVGMGTNNPASPLHIVGKEQLNAIGGWRRAITISQGSIAFVNADNSSPAFFMAYQSGSPNGNFPYQKPSTSLSKGKHEKAQRNT